MLVVVDGFFLSYFSAYSFGYGRVIGMTSAAANGTAGGL